MLLMSKSDETKLILYTHAESKQFVHDWRVSGAEVKPIICQVQSSFPHRHNNLPQHALHPGHLPPTNNHTQGVLCLEGRGRDVQDLHAGM